MVAVFSRKMSKIPHLASFLNDDVRLYSRRFKKHITNVAGWGAKKSAYKARQFAERNALPYVSVEDGFLRSFGLGVEDHPPLSLVVDDIGIYYDASRPSSVENFLNSEGWETQELLQDARKAISLIVEHNLSKYNHAPDADISIIKGKSKKRVLLVDQTVNDMSVLLGMADEGSFRAMYDAAINENPLSDIYIKIHPDVIAGKKKGYLLRVLSQESGVNGNNRTFIIAEDVNPLSLIRLMDIVYVVTSQMGFEALLLNKPVTCFGMPFYAGWGVTDDRVSCSRRIKKRTVLEIFAAAYLKYARYINPAVGERGIIFDVIEHLIRQKRCVSMNSHDYYCFGFRWWKRGYVRPFLKGINNKVVFAKNVKDALQNGLSKKSKILVWGHNETEEIKNLAVSLDIPIWRVEDGFLRSVGLGSDLVRPMSLVVDRKGIYYDPSIESDLEWILNNYQFTPDLIDRAERLKQLIVGNRITKYNMEQLAPVAIKPGNRKVILVPGQVEDDASIRLGAGSINTNEGLLKAVRNNNPDAFIIYKPHPDVLAKNRSGSISNKKIKNLCDWIETKISVISCIEAVDEVHTITSLSGFDALLRDKKVVVYGKPFYAGWGLTIDNMPMPARARKLTLHELIAGALILYPRYFDVKTNSFVECEAIIERIIAERDRLQHNAGLTISQKWIGGQIKKTLILIKIWIAEKLSKK